VAVASLRYGETMKEVPLDEYMECMEHGHPFEMMMINTDIL
jgi:hypothetical protein